MSRVSSHRSVISRHFSGTTPSKQAPQPTSREISLRILDVASFLKTRERWSCTAHNTPSYSSTPHTNMDDRCPPRSRIRRRPTGGFASGGGRRRMSSFLGATAAAALAVTGCLSPAGPRPVQAQPIPEVIENQPQAATNLRRRGGDVASSSGTSSEGIESRRGSLADEFDPSSPLDNRQNNGETLSSANTFHDYNLDMMGPPASGSSGGTSSSGSTGTGTTPPPAAVMTSFALRGKGGGIAAMATTTKDTADTGYAFDSSRPPPPIVLDDEVVAAARRIAQTTQRTDAANSTRTEVVAPSVEDADLDDSSHEEDVPLSSNNAGMDSPVGAPIDRREIGRAHV